MGNRFSRGRDTPANSAETAAPEQKTEAESAAAQAAEDSGITLTQQAVEPENLDEGIPEQVTQLASFGTQQLVLKIEVDEVPDADPEPVAKETPAPVQAEPLVSVSNSLATESEPVAEPQPVAEAQLAPEPSSEPDPKPEPVSEQEPVPEPVSVPEPVPVPEPVSEPEPEPAPEQEPVPKPEPVPEPEHEQVPVPEPEHVPKPEEEVEAVPEPISESVPAPTEAMAQKTDLFSQESLPEPAISSPLIDLGVLDKTPQPVDIPPSPATVTAEVPSDVPVNEECQDGAEISVIPTFEPEKTEETSESEEKPIEVEAAGNLEQLASVVSEESISGQLKNLELTGNDLVADLISTDVEIPDAMSTSTELM
ncbi:protein TsetseEP-like [Cyclopterus lumpus]|uniref:protein TsetseEP-like n=1 Tax=Cyclopterus lumpus TaxID=8103 RepID=UPI001486A4D7|nr:protein TsetseEP-like [Cyclopterus lumpus]